MYPTLTSQLRAITAALILAVLLFAAATAFASAHHQPCHPKSACEVPEIPFTLLMPAAGVGVAGAYYLVNRWRGRGGSSDE